MAAGQQAGFWLKKITNAVMRHLPHQALCLSSGVIAAAIINDQDLATTRFLGLITKRTYGSGQRSAAVKSWNTTCMTTLVCPREFARDVVRTLRPASRD